MPALLDTGALELLRRRDRRVEALALRHYPPLICPHVAGEFLFGQRHAKVSTATLTEAQAFLGSFELLPVTAVTADTYARLRADLSARASRCRTPTTGSPPTHGKNTYRSSPPTAISGTCRN